MPEYVAKFRVEGLLVSGIEMPEKEEIDQDFVIFRLKNEPESGIALLRFQSEEDYYVSNAYRKVKKRLLDFISINSVYRKSSAKTVSLGVQEIEKGDPLDASKLEYITLTSEVIYSAEQKPKVIQREYQGLKGSIEIFKMTENTLQNNAYLTNAIHYFYYSQAAERIEERLINLFVSLEALFLTERIELGYRLSLRVASLIRNFYIDRKPQEIAQEIRDLYGKRSALVHGDPLKITWDEMSRLEDYTSKSIQMFIKLSQRKSKIEILKLIDDSLFDERISESFGKLEEDHR